MIELKITSKLHKGKKRILLQTEYDKQFIAPCTTHNYCDYSATKKCWHIPYYKSNLLNFIAKSKDICIIKMDQHLQHWLKPKIKTSPIFLSIENVKVIISQLVENKYQLMVYLAFSLGLRVSELTSIKLNHFNVDYSQLKIYHKKRRLSRTLALNQELIQKITSYLTNAKPSNYLFENNSSLPISPTNFYKKFKMACLNANIKVGSIPSLRYSYAQHLKAEGYSIDKIQELLGHSRKSITIKFLNVHSNIQHKLEPNLGSITF